MRKLIEKTKPGRLDEKTPLERLKAYARAQARETGEKIKKRHMMLPMAVLNKLPPLYSQENEKDPMVAVKFFDPRGAGTWLATEYDPKQGLFFGFVMGLMQGVGELGYFTLRELEQNGIERDEHWKARRLSAAKRDVRGSQGHNEDTDTADELEFAEDTMMKGTRIDEMQRLAGISGLEESGGDLNEAMDPVDEIVAMLIPRDTMKKIAKIGGMESRGVADQVRAEVKTKLRKVLDARTQAAISRLRLAGKQADVEGVRNLVFKAGNEMGVKLPHGNF